MQKLPNFLCGLPKGELYKTTRLKRIWLLDEPEWMDVYKPYRWLSYLQTMISLDNMFFTFLMEKLP
ncbi:unnamed protein product [Linum tenue]|uniref:Uncharacterized protein n=1 Tax=Linum tenue TaxID=586396 RepID=A0AAV0LU91_9ROSI|nr:unnamed protein product [Linum tenue]